MTACSLLPLLFITLKTVFYHAGPDDVTKQNLLKIL